MLTEEQKQILSAKARVAADDLFLALEEVIQKGHVPARREHARQAFVKAAATLAALAGGFVPEEVDI